MKRILFLLALTMSVLLLACSKNSDDVKTALNDTAIFSQEDINCVNNHIKEMEEFEEEDWRFTTTSKTINSSTIEYCGYRGTDKTNTYSTKIEKKNGIVVCTYSAPDSPSEVYYELTIPRVFDDFDSNDYFTSAENTGLSLLLRNNGLDGINTGCTEITPGIISLDILLGSSPNYTYEGKIIKDNNKYYFLDSTGIIGSADTLEALIANTNVKAKLQAELNKIN